jgi:hypothetical protein
MSVYYRALKAGLFSFTYHGKYVCEMMIRVGFDYIA